MFLYQKKTVQIKKEETEEVEAKYYEREKGNKTWNVLMRAVQWKLLITNPLS